MPYMPGAIQRPIEHKFLPCDSSGNRLRKVAHNRMTVHCTAGTGSPWGFFNHLGRASSEFFVYKDGRFEQYGDSDLRFEADLDGSDATHSVEFECSGYEPLTDEQVATGAHIYRWLRETHGVPNKIATDSKIGESSHGLSWHRLGIDGNFPALPSPLAGRLQRGGGMHYSTSRGKMCPGDQAVGQIPGMFALSQDGAPAQPVANPVSPATPAPAPAAPARQRNVARSRATQAAVGATVDSYWGDDTDRRVNLVREALNGHFPEGVRVTQQIVGTKADGSWGPNSKAALRSTVVELQRAWGTSADGIWGNDTEQHWVAARNENYKVW